MKTCNSLQEIIDYILKKHKYLKEGAFAMKFLRKHNGKRIVIEHMDGFRIFEYAVHNETSLVMTQFASGMVFKGKEKINMVSKLFLDNLVMVNSYDHSAEFFTFDSIDFSFIEKTYAAEIELLDEMIRGKKSELRAQYVQHNPEVDKILEEISSGRKMIVKRGSNRNIIMDDNHL
jgi:hypothetical protein